MPATAWWCPTRSVLANPPSRYPTCISTRWRATPSRCSIICKSQKPTSSRIRWAACSACASRAPIRTGSRICCWRGGSGWNLTAEGYRKPRESNYSLKLPPDQVTPFIDARFNFKGSPEYPRWLRAFVNSAQMIYREPVVHEIPLVTQPTLFIMGADDHNAPGKPNAPEALRPKMGHNAELAQALAAKMPDAAAEAIPDTGHLVFLEAPEKFNELMLAFLAK